MIKELYLPGFELGRVMMGVRKVAIQFGHSDFEPGESAVIIAKDALAKCDIVIEKVETKCVEDLTLLDAMMDGEPSIQDWRVMHDNPKDDEIISVVYFKVVKA